MILFYQPQIPQGVFHLDEDESKHCVKVLRKKPGDSIDLTDGSGSFYKAIIQDADSRKCVFTITETRQQGSRPFHLHIAISPTKNADRIEWFVEKAVEFGVDEISLIECEHTERSYIRHDRLEKVAVSAMKQSLKAYLPKIHPLLSFPEIIETKTRSKYIAYVDSSNPVHLMNAAKDSNDVIVLIGPEGDFSEEELQQAGKHGFQKVSLGSSRLRTETAGLAACHIINLLHT